MTQAPVESRPDPSTSVPPAPAPERSYRPLIAILAGAAVFAAMLLLPPPAGMPVAAWRTAAAGVLMAIWWITEPIPIAATALLPLVLFPLLGILAMDAAAAPYANPVIFLFLGGFLLAQAMQRWDLHRRIALMVILGVGTEPKRLIGGFMLATGFISMWVSNTATAVMMLPIGLSVVARSLPPREDGRPRDPGESNFAVALMLGIAYACSIGGMGTLIGTPPNALLAGFLSTTYGVEIGFSEWMAVGVPLVAVGLPLSWLVLTRVAFPVRLQGIPGGAAAIRSELHALGRWSSAERRVAAVFVLAATLWVLRPVLAGWIPGLSDTGIAIGAAMILFLLPASQAGGRFVLTWDDARGLPWDVLILFGGGLALADAITATGLAEWLGGALAGLEALPVVLLILCVAVVITGISELASNTATAAAFLPILGSLAVGIGLDPVLLAVPAALAASCGFMMPVATPPNALVYGSSFVTIPQMVRGGAYLDVLFVGLITILGYALIVIGVTF